MTKLHLTNRALVEIQEIYDYSIEKWGKSVADNYLDGLEQGLLLVQKNPNLLQLKTQVSKRFSTYLCQNHFFIFDQIDETLFLLTVQHTSMNVLDRLQKLEPTLETEAKFLYDRLKESRF